jgi:hypothetical protein
VLTLAIIGLTGRSHRTESIIGISLFMFEKLELHSSHGSVVRNVNVRYVSLTLFLTRLNGLQKGEINGTKARQIGLDQSLSTMI